MMVGQNMTAKLLALILLCSFSSLILKRERGQSWETIEIIYSLNGRLLRYKLIYSNQRNVAEETITKIVLTGNSIHLLRCRIVYLKVSLLLRVKQFTISNTLLILKPTTPASDSLSISVEGAINYKQSLLGVDI